MNPWFCRARGDQPTRSLLIFPRSDAAEEEKREHVLLDTSQKIVTDVKKKIPVAGALLTFINPTMYTLNSKLSLARKRLWEESSGTKNRCRAGR